MAIRPLIKTVSVLLLLLVAVPSLACFGPKLYLGVSDDATGQVMASFVAIYVKETTGTDVVRVPLDGHDPVAEVREEKIDFSFINRPESGVILLLDIDGLPQLITGPRIDYDLQFTTVRPTLVRLAEKLNAEDVNDLTKQVVSGELAMDVVRQFLIERRWI